MTLDEIHGLLLGQECEHRSALCAQCIAAAMRQIETWHARAELVRDLDDDAIAFARDGGKRLRAERDEWEATAREWGETALATRRALDTPEGASVVEHAAQLRDKARELERQRDEWRDAWAAIARVAREVSR